MCPPRVRPWALGDLQVPVSPLWVPWYLQYLCYTGTLGTVYFHGSCRSPPLGRSLWNQSSWTTSIRKTNLQTY